MNYWPTDPDTNANTEKNPTQPTAEEEQKVTVSESKNERELTETRREESLGREMSMRERGAWEAHFPRPVNSANEEIEGRRQKWEAMLASGKIKIYRIKGLKRKKHPEELAEEGKRATQRFKVTLDESALEGYIQDLRDKSLQQRRSYSRTWEPFPGEGNGIHLQERHTKCSD